MNEEKAIHPEIAHRIFELRQSRYHYNDVHIIILQEFGHGLSFSTIKKYSKKENLPKWDGRHIREVADSFAREVLPIAEKMIENLKGLLTMFNNIMDLGHEDIEEIMTKYLGTIESSEQIVKEGLKK